jgi:hypothetical protein
MAGSARQALRGWVPIALGHAAAVALVVPAVLWRMPLHRGVLLAAAIGLLAVAVVLQWAGRMPDASRHMGLALGSFALSTAHGAGLALVPALLPLCIGLGPDGHIAALEVLLPTLSALAFHALVMLAMTGLAAAVAGRAWCALSSRAARPPTPIRHLG